MEKDQVLKNKKYIVICIAGQSNALGYDESEIEFPRDDNPCPDRILQLGFRGDHNLKLIPLTYCAEAMQDLTPHNRPSSGTPGTKGLPLPLAKALLHKIPEDYGLLFVPISFGGTGFTSGEVGRYDEESKKPYSLLSPGTHGPLRWGKSTPYAKTLADRISYALSLHPENKFLSLIWCQGEQDNEDSYGHFCSFDEMTREFFHTMNERGFKNRVAKGIWDKDIWYNMETVAYWYQFPHCVKIWENYRNWNPSTYISIPRETPSNRLNGTGSTASIREAHFGNNAFSEVIAPIVMENLQKNCNFTFFLK